jgi:precorrin-6B methylase 2
VKQFYFIRCLTIALCLLLAAMGGYAQESKAEYTPTSGQAGKDVVWVPTPQELVDTMLDMANVTSSDYVIDLGSGDGRLVISAAKRGATALGIEYNPDMVELARRAAAEAGVSERATFEQADIFESDFSKATVITMFLLSDLNLRLRPQILDMKPGTRVVSNSFDMETWQADRIETVTGDVGSYNTAYFWIVPAKVDGIWKLEGGDHISFTQNFQNVTGAITMGKKAVELSGRLTGDKLVFTAGGTEYTGTVSGDRISGIRAGGGSWQATR